MHKQVSVDQATGLRRLLGPKQVRLIPVIAGAPGMGKTMFVVNFAAASARSGLRVVILDQTHGDVASALGLRSRYELRHVLQGDCALKEVVLAGAPSVWIVPAARGLDSLLASSAPAQLLVELVTAVARDLDLVLVNVPCQRARSACTLITLAERGREAVLVASASPASITATYAEIKQLARTLGQQDFRVVINRAPSAEAAELLFDNITKAAHGCKGLQVRYGGFIPMDHCIKRARAAHKTIFATASETSCTQAFQHLVLSCGDWDVPRFNPPSSSAH